VRVVVLSVWCTHTHTYTYALANKMPCKDCAGLHVELLTLKEFMAQWFTILMQKIDTIEKSNQELVERIDGGGGGAESKVTPTTTSVLLNECSRSGVIVNHVKTPRKRPPITNNVLNTRINFLLNRAQAQLDNKPHENGNSSHQIDNGSICTKSSVIRTDDNDSVPSATANTPPKVTPKDYDALVINYDDDDDSIHDQSPVKRAKHSEDSNEDDEKFDGDMDMSRSALAIIHGPGKYTCRLCKSDFTQMSNLRRHVRVIHQRLTKYACRYCAKEFAWKGAWRRHEQYVHELRPNTIDSNQ